MQVCWLIYTMHSAFFYLTPCIFKLIFFFTYTVSDILNFWLAVKRSIYVSIAVQNDFNIQEWNCHHIMVYCKFQFPIIWVNGPDKIIQLLNTSSLEHQNIIDVSVPPNYMAHIHPKIITAKKFPFPPPRVQVGIWWGTNCPHRSPLYSEGQFII